MQHFGMPQGHEPREWALGMKMVVELREDSGLEPGTVLHTIGFPEPEIFGFLYVHPDRLASVGIFVPSWFRSPVRTAYRYLQHFMLHPYLWRYLEGGTLKSWGAKSLQESGRHGEPFLAGNGYARIGEGSGSTNVLAGSGVDEAWTTGVQLAEAVIELCEQKRGFTRENLEATYVRRRRESWVDDESKIAADSRNGFQTRRGHGNDRHGGRGIDGRAISPARDAQAQRSAPSLEDFYGSRISPAELKQMQRRMRRQGHFAARPHHGSLRLAADSDGWQAADLAPGRAADGWQVCRRRRAMRITCASVVRNSAAFANQTVCRDVLGAGDHPRRRGVPAFDREKCVYCGACLWNCREADGEKGNIEFGAGAGGLHSALN